MSKHSTNGGRSVGGAAPKIHYGAAGPAHTSQGGLAPVIQFLDHLGFSTLFQQQVGHARNANAVYGLVDAAYLVMIGLIGGARSLSQCVAVWSDQVLRRLAGWQRLPDETTLGRLFKAVRERHVSELETLNHVLRQRVWARAAQVGRSRIGLQTQKWLDADATVKTVYGRQEGAEPLVLEGMRQTIKNSPDLVMLVEYNPIALKAGGFTPSTLLDTLRGMDMSPMQILPSSALGEVNLSSDDTVNLLCIPTKKWINFNDV